MMTATVIPFPATRLGDPGDALFLALMQENDTHAVAFGEVIDLAARRAGAPRDDRRQDNRLEAVETSQTA